MQVVNAITSELLNRPPERVLILKLVIKTTADWSKS